MTVEKLVPTKGLEGVVVAQSSLCSIDGTEGRLIFRGYNIHDLAASATFEEVVHLLLFGELPTQAQLDALSQRLSANRAIPAEVVELLRRMPKDTVPMAALRTAVSALALYDAEAEDNRPEANERKAIRLIAQFPTIMGAFHRLRTGVEPVAPNPDLGHAANFLYMLTGKAPDREMGRAFDVALVLHADHEMNASTFAALVTTSTLSDMYSGITSAIGTLKGPLHGGANTKVMEMLQEVGTADRAESYIKDALANKKKIMGFGHRVYKTEDPRATVLRRTSQHLGERAGDLRWFQISQTIEREVWEQKKLYPNVDFYSASTYHYMGIPGDLFTPIFAVSRISGWAAHVLEQYADNRLIRPDSEYVGPKERPFVPLEAR